MRYFVVEYRTAKTVNVTMEQVQSVLKSYAEELGLSEEECAFVDVAEYFAAHYEDDCTVLEGDQKFIECVDVNED